MARFRTLLNITNWILIIFVLITTASLLSVLFAKSHVVTELDARMHLITDISAYGAMVFAAVALVISTAALKVSVQKPELSLEIDTGFERFKGTPNLKLEIHRETRAVLARQEKAHWRLLLSNKGNASARYPVVQIELHDVRLLGNPGGWQIVSSTGIKHTVLQWKYPGNMDVVIHPNFPFEISPLDLRNIRLEPTNGVMESQVKLSVTIAADGFFRKGLTWHIQLDDAILNYEFEQWLRQTLNVAVGSSFSPPEGGVVRFYEDVVKIYRGPIPPTYEYLISLPLAESNWAPVFQEWRSKGYIQ